MNHFRIDMDGRKGGPWMGHCLSETGCIWLADTPQDVLDKAASEIVKFQQWLSRHGEPVTLPVDINEMTVQLGEQYEISDFRISGAAVGLFEADYTPVTDQDIATAVRRLGYARRELLETVAGLPETALDWQPPSGKRTIRQNLHHVRNCHGWYLTRVLGWDMVAEILPEPWPEETWESMRWVMDRAVDTLLSLPAELRQGEFQAEKPREIWTPRKMLRRFVEHEREHAAIVKQTVEVYHACVKNG